LPKDKRTKSPSPKAQFKRRHQKSNFRKRAVDEVEEAVASDSARFFALFVERRAKMDIVEMIVTIAKVHLQSSVVVSIA
jgi:hypothetical protein